MHSDEEYIAYRPDKYIQANRYHFKNDQDEFPDEKTLPNFKWNKFVYNHNYIDSSDISFKRVKRDDEDEAEPPAEEAPEGGGGGGGDTPPGQSEEPKLYLTPIMGITGFFAAVMLIGPFLVRKGPNRGIIQCCILMSAFCIWIFWVTVYIAQMNPLIGPRLENTTIAWIAYKLGNPVKPAENPGE